MSPVIVPQVRGQPANLDLFSQFARGYFGTKADRRAEERLDLQKQMATEQLKAIQIGREQERADTKAFAQSQAEEAQRMQADAVSTGLSQRESQLGGSRPPEDSGLLIRQALEAKGASPRLLDAKNNLKVLADSGVSIDVLREISNDLDKEISGNVADKTMSDFGRDLVRTIDRSQNPDIPFSDKTAALAEQTLEQLNNPGLAELDPKERIQFVSALQERLNASKLEDLEEANDLETRLNTSNGFSTAVDEWKNSDQYKNMPGDAKHAQMTAFNAFLLHYKQGGPGAPTAGQLDYSFKRMTDQAFDQVATESDLLKERKAIADAELAELRLYKAKHETSRLSELTPSQRATQLNQATEDVATADNSLSLENKPKAGESKGWGKGDYTATDVEEWESRRKAAIDKRLKEREEQLVGKQPTKGSSEEMFNPIPNAPGSQKESPEDLIRRMDSEGASREEIKAALKKMGVSGTGSP